MLIGGTSSSAVKVRVFISCDCLMIALSISKTFRRAIEKLKEAESFCGMIKTNLRMYIGLQQS